MPEAGIRNDPRARLTARERECLDLVARHWRTKEIARRLKLSPGAVDDHVRSAARKLGVADRATAARIWLGYEPPPEGDRPASGPARSPLAQLDAMVMGAGRWSLLIGGAVGGLLLLVAGLARNDASAALSRFMPALAPLPGLVLPLACLVAYRIGAWPERAAAVLALTWAVAQTTLGPPTGLPGLVGEGVVALGLLALAALGRRPWLQLAGAAALLGLLTHPAYAGGQGLSPTAYAVVLGLWRHAAVAAILCSVLAPRRRPVTGDGAAA